MPTETKKSDNVLEQFLSEFETLSIRYYGACIKKCRGRR